MFLQIVNDKMNIFDIAYTFRKHNHKEGIEGRCRNYHGVIREPFVDGQWSCLREGLWNQAKTGA